MKIQIIFFSLGLWFVPFAFWKMDGPFGQILNEEKDISNQITICKLKDHSEVRKVFFKPGRRLCTKNIYNHLYIYNPETGYSIGSVNNHDIEFKKVFFLGEDFRDFSQYFVSNQFYFCKENPGIVQTDITEPTESIKVYSFLKDRNIDEFLTVQKKFIILNTDQLLRLRLV